MKDILSSSKKTWGTIGLCFLLFLFSISLLVTRRVLVEVFPNSDQVLFVIKAKLPEGTKLEETEKLIPSVEKTLQEFFKPQEPNNDIFLKSYVFTVGKTSNAVQRSDRSVFEEENVLSVTVNLTDKDFRKTKSYQIVPIIRKALEKTVPKYVELSFAEQGSGPPTGAPIEIRLTGTDLNHLEKLTDTLKQEISKLPGTQDVRDTRSERVTQMTWTLKRDVLAYFGLTPVEIMESLRAAVNGVTVVKLTEGDKEINVDLKIDWEGNKKWQDPQSLDYLNQIPIKTRAGNFITFQQVATPELFSELAQIDHRNGTRIMTVRSDLQKGIVASKLEPQIKKSIQKLEKNNGETIEMGGDTEEGNRIMMEMITAMMVAMFLIFVTLMWEFDSFVQSLIILGIIPLSLTFVFIGFWIIGLPVSMPTMIGIVALAGIIVKNAIVLIDRINHQEKGDEKLSLVDRCILGSKQRLRPIYLTSAATAIGLIPLSLSDEVWAGLGFAIIFGMIFSTVLSLVLVPCFIVSFERIKNWGSKKNS